MYCVFENLTFSADDLFGSIKNNGVESMFNENKIYQHKFY